MAKKKFSDGLDTLFGDSLDNEKNQSSKTSAKKKTKRNSSRKSFTGNLELLFQEVLEESVHEKTAELKANKSTKSKRKTPVATGLDALIKSTIEGSSFSESDKKRITFTFDADKVKKLRSIAKLERARIKDIVNELVSEYIDKYDDDNSK